MKLSFLQSMDKVESRSTHVHRLKLIRMKRVLLVQRFVKERVWHYFLVHFNLNANM